MRFTAITGDGQTISFDDRKRWVWLIGGSYTFGFPFIAMAIYFALGQPLWAVAIPAVHLFLLIPLADMIVGEEKSNPPEQVVKAMTDDRFYMRVVYILTMIGYAGFIGTMWFIDRQGLPIWAGMLFLLGVAIQNGTMITLGHELGHKTNKTDRLWAKIALACVGYGHFTGEHNLGHHKNVSTPEDCSSGRFGETVYHFAGRDIVGAFKGAWALEKSRLEKRGQSLFSVHNEILQSYAITVGVAGVLVAWLGMDALPWILIHHALAYFALSMVNYIEHYGLLRQKMPNGRYELCAPKHSWNTNHILSNVLQINLQRHSDHHAYPMRPYQALRNYEELPSLPSGYPGCLAMASFPPLWFRVMNPKVMALAEGDLSKTNLHEPARARLEEKWGKGSETA